MPQHRYVTVAYTPEQVTAAATVWLAVGTCVLAAVTVVLGIVGWRTYRIGRESLRIAVRGLQEQLRSATLAGELAAQAHAHATRLATVQGLVARVILLRVGLLA